MSATTARLTFASVIACLLPGAAMWTEDAQAGAFIGSDNAARQISFAMHPKNFVLAGGSLNNSVCLNTSVLPSGVSAASVENTVLKVLRSWNRMRGFNRNLSAAFGNNDVPFVKIDYESTLVHELGHCIGLAHPNLATESGLSDPDRNSTQARPGDDATFDTNAGTDGNMGSSDDLRDDDVNRYWFFPGSNDPFALPTTIDQSTFSVDLANLPTGHTFAANGDRSVLAALGYPGAESVMQQGQTNDEAQRRPTNEDIATLRIGMAGFDETQGTSDDYTLSLTYGGQVTSNSGCDIYVTFDSATSFAVCQVSFSTYGAPNNDHGFINSATIKMSDSTDWYFSQTENTSISASTTPSTPTQGATTTVNASVDRLSSDMTGTPQGSFEASLAGGSCSGSLSASDSDTSTGSCQLTPTTSGNQTLSLLYLGQEGFDAVSASQAVSVTSSALTPTVSISNDSPDPSTVGQSYSVVVSVTGSGATPTGSVSVSDGAAGCTITLASGSGSCNLTSTTAGGKTLTASYGGDSNYNSGSDTEAHTVTKAAPTVTITSDSPDPSSVGQSYSIGVSVSGAGATPTGSVSVSDGAVSCNITLSAGSGSCSLSSLVAGNKTLTANYAGDNNYSAGSDSEAHTVSTLTATVTITSDSPDPSTAGQSYNVGVTVSGSGVTPTGSVSVSDGATSCNISLSAGSGSCDLSSATAGGKTLTASYGGDSIYSAASDTEPHTVNKATPTAIITSDSPDPSVAGQSYSIGVSVSGAGATPTGSVSVSDGADSCNINLSTGSGSCTLTSASTGSKTLTANYAGDANYSSASDTESHTVSGTQIFLNGFEDALAP